MKLVASPDRRRHGRHSATPRGSARPSCRTRRSLRSFSPRRSSFARGTHRTPARRERSRGHQPNMPPQMSVVGPFESPPAVAVSLRLPDQPSRCARRSQTARETSSTWPRPGCAGFDSQPKRGPEARRAKHPVAPAVAVRRTSRRRCGRSPSPSRGRARRASRVQRLRAASAARRRGRRLRSRPARASASRQSALRSVVPAAEAAATGLARLEP